MHSLQTKIPFSLSINGKFAAQINLPPSYKGDGQAILAHIKEHSGDLESILLKGSVKKLS